MVIGSKSYGPREISKISLKGVYVKIDQNFKLPKMAILGFLGFSEVEKTIQTTLKWVYTGFWGNLDSCQKIDIFEFFDISDHISDMSRLMKISKNHIFWSFQNLSKNLFQPICIWFELEKRIRKISKCSKIDVLDRSIYWSEITKKSKVRFLPF